MTGVNIESNDPGGESLRSDVSFYKIACVIIFIAASFFGFFVLHEIQKPTGEVWFAYQPTKEDAVRELQGLTLNLGTAEEDGKKRRIIYTILPDGEKIVIVAYPENSGDLIRKTFR